MSMMRVSGLASGIDTESMIKQLMDARRAPVVKLIQKKQTIEWQREAYRDMNSLLYDFRNNKLFNFKLEGNLQSKTASVSDSSVVSVKTNGSAVNGTLNIQVNQLATAASKWSYGDIRAAANNGFNPSDTLDNQAAKLAGTPASGEYKFKINGKEITVDTSKDTLNNVLERINKETNVNAFFDSSTGKISLSSKETGLVNGVSKDQEYISFEDPDGFLFNVLKIRTSANYSTDSKKASNADVTINGLSTTRTTNTFTVNGVEVTLLKGSGASTSINVKTNTDELVDKIKGFIEDYNTTLKTLQDKVTERRYRDFSPLTDEQKEEMSDKQIEQWEDKAKSGMLKGDAYLNQVINDMRMAIMGQVETGNKDYKTLSSIGIETGEYEENGKLYLTDEQALREAIEKDPDAVIAMFTANGNGDSNRNDVGIAERMYEDIQRTLDNFIEKAGLSSDLIDDSVLGKQLDDVTDEILSWNDRLTDIENRYYRQFAAMERAISNLNNQSAYLMNSFGQ